MQFPSLVLTKSLTVGQPVACADKDEFDAAAATDPCASGAAAAVAEVLQGQVVVGLVTGDGVLVAAAAADAFVLVDSCAFASLPRDYVLEQMHFDIPAGDDGFGAAVESDASVAGFPASSCYDRFAMAPAAALL